MDEEARAVRPIIFGTQDQQLGVAIRQALDPIPALMERVSLIGRDGSAAGSLGERDGKRSLGELDGASTYMRVDPYQPNLDLSSPGDSGGPVYYFNEAWGIVEGSWAACGCSLIYTAINYVETGVGVRVLTS